MINVLNIARTLIVLCIFCISASEEERGVRPEGQPFIPPCICVITQPTSSNTPTSTIEVRGYNPSIQTISGTATALVAYTAISFDAQNTLTTTGPNAGTFTAPVTGTYTVMTTMTIQGSSGSSNMVTLTLTDINGNPYVNYQAASELNSVGIGNYNALFTWATTIELTAGNTLQIRATNSASSAVTIHAYAEININLLSAS